MNRIYYLLQKNKFFILTLTILLISFALRFYNYDNRWGLAYDQARDMLVAREAVRTLHFPLIGPFSSAGQFVYGPQWYLILMAFTLIPPYIVITPWVIQTLLYVGMVGVMMLIGKELKGKYFGLVLGLLISVSPAQIGQSTNLTSPSMVGIFAIISVYVYIMYIKTGKPLYIFLEGFFISTAVNIHFQAIGLLCLLPLSLILGKKNKKNTLFLIIGAFIPFIPLLIFDLTNNFFESRNMLDYYLYGQYKIYLPNRWLTYIGVFWPKAWSSIIGGDVRIGYISLVLWILSLGYAIKKRLITREILAILLGLVVMLVMLRYYRGERYDSYVTFFHPFVFIITGLTVFYTYKFNKIIGMLFIFLLIIGSLFTSIHDIIHATNFMAAKSLHWEKTLQEKYSNKQFAIYDYNYKTAGQSMPLVLFLDYAGEIDSKGYKLGIAGSHSIPQATESAYKTIMQNKIDYELYDLNSSTSAELIENGWLLVTPDAIYHSTIEWYKDNE